jgi:internalin A
MTRDEALRRINLATDKKITKLDLSGLELQELPPEIGKCTQLESLDLSGIGLTEIPEILCQLSHLSVLDLSYNQIAAIPDFLAQLSNQTLTSIIIGLLSSQKHSENCQS